jgi:hypothetical protein
VQLGPRQETADYRDRGRPAARPPPSHTTVLRGPYTAVRQISKRLFSQEGAAAGVWIVHRQKVSIPGSAGPKANLAANDRPSVILLQTWYTLPTEQARDLC